MRVLVTGASGFVGRQVTARLLEHGHEVVTLTRHVTPDGAPPNARLRHVRGDVVTGAGLEEAMAGTQAALHLVGIIRERGGRVTFERVHVEGTRQVLAAAAAAGVERYLHMSALGAERGSASGYADSKARAEALVAASGLAWTILRPSLIFGPGSEFFGKTLKNLVRLPPVIPQLGDGSFPFRPVWAGDVSLAFARALERPATALERYDVVGPVEYSFRELLELVRGALGVRKPIVSVPLPLMRLALPVLALLPEPPITRDQFVMLLAGNTGDPEPARAAFDLPLEPLPPRLPETLGLERG